MDISHILRARQSEGVFWGPQVSLPYRIAQQKSGSLPKTRLMAGPDAGWSSFSRHKIYICFHASMTINDAHHSQTSYYWPELAICVFSAFLLVLCLKVCQQQVTLLTFHPNNGTPRSTLQFAIHIRSLQ